MKAAYKNIDSNLVLRLKEKFFSDTSKILDLKKGDYLLHQNQKNKKLYLVLEGIVAGYLDIGSGNKQEIFRSESKMFVGVHSFFSASFSAYADVIALKASKLAYIDIQNFDANGIHELIEDFAPIIVHELSARQLFTKDVMLEKEAAMKKLYQSEKLATLGQMAAGLAHELNNAIGVLNGNSEWIAQEVYKYFKDTEIETIFKYFDRGFNEGQTLSSTEVREQKKILQKKLKTSSHAAKKLARIGFHEESISQFSKIMEVDEIADRMHHFWEMGVSIHDIKVASRHAVHVLKSIKQLSVTDQERCTLELDDTMREALTLLKNTIRDIKVIYTPGSPVSLIANNGELVQIWVNIIKNACESLHHAKTTNPTLIIETVKKRNNAWIRISDNGPGIPQRVVKKIFQPNFTTKKGGLSFGLGLGLSIVQRLIDSYNGKIEVICKPGKTSFLIKIPIT